MNIYYELERLHKDLHVDVEGLRKGLRVGQETIENKVTALGSIIFENYINLSSHVIDYLNLYSAIIQDLAVVNSPKAVRLAKLIEEIDYQSKLSQRTLAGWLYEHPDAASFKESDFKSNPEKVLKALDALQRSVTTLKPFQRIFDTELSKMVVSLLNLCELNQVRSLKFEPELKAMALGHFINVKKIPLCELSIKELKQIAPYLIDVNCLNVQFKDDLEAQEFVQGCSNAYLLEINSDKITALKLSSSKLQTLNCNNCTSLRKVSLSHLVLFETLGCQKCTALTELALSDLPSLRAVYSTGCVSLETLSLFNLPSLQKLYLNSCTALRSFTLANFPLLQILEFPFCTNLSGYVLSNLPSLQELAFPHCTALEDFALGNLPSLQKLKFSHCTVLRGCFLSNLLSLQELQCCFCTALGDLSLTNLPSLRELDCLNCSSLEKIISNYLPNFKLLNRKNCPNLKVLPQIPQDATIIS